MEEKKNLTHKSMFIYLSLYSMLLTSIKEKMKRNFLHQEKDFSDSTGHTSPSCYVAPRWPQLPLICKIYSYFWLEKKINK